MRSRRLKSQVLSPVQLLDDLAHRFYRMGYVENENGCHIWLGSKTGKGYSKIYYNGHFTSAHRAIFLINGYSLGKKDVIDHLCRQVDCVNIEHLRIVDYRINALENSHCPSAKNFKKTHCLRGHALSGDNLKVYEIKSGRMGRWCRTCIKLRSLNRYRGKGKEVQMRLFKLLIVGLFSIASVWAESCTLSWDNNTESNLGGYKIHVGKVTGVYDEHFDVGNTTSQVVLNLVPTQPYFFVVTAYDTNTPPLESDNSNEVSYTPTAPPIKLSIFAHIPTIQIQGFVGGFFTLEKTTDFKNWEPVFVFEANTIDRIDIPWLQMPGRNEFYRVKLDRTVRIPVAAVPPAAFQVASQWRKNLPPAPPLPPSAFEKPKVVSLSLAKDKKPQPPLPPMPPGMEKYMRWHKLKNFFRYRPGHHVDERKGAERLIEK